MVIRYLSAGDRINYGDFLFSLIFKEYFQSKFSIKYYGIVKSDYSKFGGIPTDSYKCLIKERNKTNDVIVIGGGEIFFADWNKLYSFIYPWYSKLLSIRYISRITKILKIGDILFFHTKNKFPFVPNLGCEKIYIAAGGGFNKNLKQKDLKFLIHQLSQVNFLSVRDLRTKQSLGNNNLYAELVPDSAVLMSKIYPKNQLKEYIKNQNIFEIKSNYIFLQIGYKKGPKNLNQFIQDIENFAVEKNLLVVCCPIGSAPGHEDDVILKKMYNLAPSWKYVNPHSIYDIMYLIAQSEIYVGTSLHGLITAFSYSVPAISLNKKLKKTSSFIQTWCSEFYQLPIGYEEIGYFKNKIYDKWNIDKAKKQLQYCQDMVENYFDKISEYLKNKNG
jgi:polysaccharide pyruvyl transferase WcaK-like protein